MNDKQLAELFALVRILVEDCGIKEAAAQIFDAHNGRLRGDVINESNQHLFRLYRNRVTGDPGYMIDAALDAAEAQPYKYEGFSVGDVIKAYDHEPCEFFGRREKYLVGRIEEVNRNGQECAPFAHYVVRISEDATFTGEYRRKYALVPMESTMDYDGRVTLVEAAEEEDDG